MALFSRRGKANFRIETKVTDRDRGWKRAMSNLGKLNEVVTIVGLPFNGKTTGGRTMSEVIKIGIQHEFGDPRLGLPRRSFVRATVDENQREIFSLQRSVVRRVLVPGFSARREMGHIGRSVKNMIKAKIMSGRFAPLRPATIRKKGHSRPLIETKQLFKTIQHKVLRSSELLFSGRGAV